MNYIIVIVGDEGTRASELQEDRQKLIEHYDRWLEEYSKLREGPDRNLDESFVFVGPEGYPFPKNSADKFRKRLATVLAKLGSKPDCS